MSDKSKIYFISDVHLGLYPPEKSRGREKILVEWLNSIEDDVKELYLLGDIFDFWHEYRHVVPKGHIRFLGKLAELAEACRQTGGVSHEADMPYDLAMRFEALPRVSLLLLFNDRDDEFPAGCKMLFNRHAEAYLDPESLAMTGSMLAKRLNIWREKTLSNG